MLAAVEKGKVMMKQPEEALSKVELVERLASEVRALFYLMRSETPPTLPLRAKQSMVGLVICDARGEAKGALVCRGGSIEYVTAQWTGLPNEEDVQLEGGY